MTNFKDVESIRELLKNLKKDTYLFRYFIGSFMLQIHTERTQEPINYTDCITDYPIVDVTLSEKMRISAYPNEAYVIINLEKDLRFKGYSPIKYKEFEGLSNGQEMPIAHLCELIKYLYRLNKLSMIS